MSTRPLTLEQVERGPDGAQDLSERSGWPKVDDDSGRGEAERRLRKDEVRLEQASEGQYQIDLMPAVERLGDLDCSLDADFIEAENPLVVLGRASGLERIVGSLHAECGVALGAPADPTMQGEHVSGSREQQPAGAGCLAI